MLLLKLLEEKISLIPDWINSGMLEVSTTKIALRTETSFRIHHCNPNNFQLL